MTPDLGRSFKDAPGFDPDLDAKLEREIPGILNRMLEGLYRLKRHGWKFTDVASSRALLDEMKALSNTIQPFLGWCCNRGLQFSASFADLYEVYKAYHRTYGGDATLMSVTKFGIKLGKTEGITKCVSGHAKTTTYRGLALNTVGAELLIEHQRVERMGVRVGS